MDKLFQGKTLIISGGLGDIGRAIALEFASKGAHVALCDVYPHASATAFLTQLSELEIRADYHQVDIADAAAVQRWVSKVEDTIGLPSLIVANAATVTFARVHEITSDQWARELNVNLNGAFYLAQSATARLIHHQHGGRLIFIGSWAAHAVHTDIPAYCVSKAAIRMLSKCLALELAPHHILVNELALGYVDAGLSGKRFAENPRLKENAMVRVPVKKLINTQDVASQVLLLCHPHNEHMTGSTILMDGGLSL